MLKEGSPSKYFFLGMIILVAIISIITVFPFLTSLIGGVILAFLFYPFYRWMHKHVRSRSIAAFITAVIIILVVTIPAIFIIQNATSESRYIYLRLKQQVFSGELIESRCYEDTFVCRLVTDINSLLREETVRTYLLNLLNDVLAFVTKKISSIILSLPKLVLYLLVTMFTTYYALKDGEDLIRRAAKVAPLKVHHQDQIIKQFADVTYAVIYGSFVVALVQGTLGAFGFWLFGIPNFIWWAIVMTFLALIPFIGTWVVWLPASFFLGLTGYLQSEPTMVWKGIGLFFYGLLIISTVDNILKPVIVAGRARVHPLLILIGILGGLFTFGFIGLILGPLILALLQKLFEIYERERIHHVKEDKTDILGHKNHHQKQR
ncbi:MAG: AI-2E family transporter [Candidatus Woesearchaeota archaeon]